MQQFLATLLAVIGANVVVIGFEYWLLKPSRRRRS